MNKEEFIDYINGKEQIVITPVSNEYLLLTRNWYESLKRINWDNMCVVVALDDEIYQELTNFKIPCVRSSYNITSNKTLDEWRDHEKNAKVFDILEIAKTYNCDIIHSEVDIIFFKNPLEKIKQEILPDYDICLISDRRFDDFYSLRKRGIESYVDRSSGKVYEYGKNYDFEYGPENFGFSYIPCTEINVKFWTNLVQNSPYLKQFDISGVGDGSFQTILIKAVKDFKLKVKCLSPFEFTNGTIWRVPYLKDKIKDSCYLVHYNAWDGDTPQECEKLKIEVMKENGHWYLD